MTGFFDVASYLGTQASAKGQFCAEYPDETKYDFCGWATGAGDQGIETFTVSGERKLDFYPQLFAGEEYLIATSLIGTDQASPETQVGGKFIRFNLGGSGATSLIATGAALLASLTLF